MDLIDIERARRQMIDVWPLERHDIGDQPMRIVKAVVHADIDIGFVVPAEGFQHFVDEPAGIGHGQTAIAFGLLGERNRAIGENPALGKNVRGSLAKVFIGDEIQPQQRGENAEGIALQLGITDRAKRCRMNRHAGGRQIVITDRVHAHDGEDARHHRKFRRCPEPDGAVPLLGNTIEIIGRLQALLKLRLCDERFVVDAGNQFHERAVGGDFLAIHRRHGGRKSAANIAGRDVIRLHVRSLPERLYHSCFAEYLLFGRFCCEREF